jgi:hypothetical protein
MRLMLASLLLVACSKDPQAHSDASIVLVDAKVIDAAVDAAPDAPPDAPNMNVVTACMHICDALFVCLGQPTDAKCYSECAADLADCSAEQVATVDACSTEECGDIEGKDSPLLTCVVGVSCIDMALASPRK